MAEPDCACRKILIETKDKLFVLLLSSLCLPNHDGVDGNSSLNHLLKSLMARAKASAMCICHYIS